MHRIRLKFDEREGVYGAKDHFFHFMLAYLLPSIHFFFKNLKKGITKNNIGIFLEFEDCGPLMNPVIKELTELLDIPNEIINKQINSFDEIVYVPRWDKELRDSFFFIFHHNKKFIFNKIILIRLIKEVVFKFDLGSIRFKFREDLLFTRKIILQRLNNLERPDNPTYLLLDRSDNHSYYTTKGETYGKARRGLLNLEEGFNDLIKKGVPVNIIQPGSHSILYQIEAFNQSKGVIGIRGAEFANLIWLEPGSKVVVLSKAILIPHLRNYAALLGLKLVVKGRDTDYPNMLDYNFKEILRK